MGLKFSKLFTKTYVVSEGIQTDLSIQTSQCDSFITPTREVQHLCDPRSVTKGIVRTPILFRSEEDISTPVKKASVSKPYLETNLDEIPFYDTIVPEHHLIEINQSSASDQPNNSNSVNDAYYLLQVDLQSPFKPTLPEDKGSTSCQISMFENTGLNESVCSTEPSTSLNFTNQQNYRQVHNSTDSSEESSHSLNKSQDETIILSKPVLINSSETVEKVCNKILDDLLVPHNDNISKNRSCESEDEIFVDGNISNIVASLKDLCIDDNYSARLKLQHDNGIPGCKNNISPNSAKVISNSNKIDKIIDAENPLKNVSSPIQIYQRKPLGEINTNALALVSSPSIVSADKGIGTSPLKPKLPLLPASVSKKKPHRSTWDSENTLII